MVTKILADPNTRKFYSHISCLLCDKKTKSQYVSFRVLRGGEPAQPAWNISNYERHLSRVHSLRSRHVPVRATRQNAVSVMESDDRAVTPTTAENRQSGGADDDDDVVTLQKRIHDDEQLELQNEPKRTCEL